MKEGYYFKLLDVGSVASFIWPYIKEQHTSHNTLIDGQINAHQTVCEGYVLLFSYYALYNTAPSSWVLVML